MDPRALLGVVGGSLMWILAVTQIHHLGEGGDQRLWERFDVREPACDCSLVRRGRCERLRRQRSPRFAREVTSLLQFGEHKVVALRAADRSDVREVLGGAAQHRRPTDIDHLDRFLLPDAEAACDFAEWIEVHADEVEGPDALVFERCDVVGVVAARKYRGVDVGVERLDPPAEHRRCARQFLDSLDLEPHLVLEEVCGAPACHQLEAEVGQPARELLQAGLVVNGDQCAQSSLTTSGRIRCSTA